MGSNGTYNFCLGYIKKICKYTLHIECILYEYIYILVTLIIYIYIDDIIECILIIWKKVTNLIIYMYNIVQLSWWLFPLNKSGPDVMDPSAEFPWVGLRERLTAGKKKTFGHRTKPKEILNSESRLVRDFSWRIDLWSKKPRTGSHGQQEIRWLPESLGKSKVHWVNCGWIRWSSSMQTSLFCVAGYWRHNHRVNSSCENLRVLPIEHLDTPVRADFEHLLTVSACLLWDWASYLENAHLVQKCCM